MSTVIQRHFLREFALALRSYEPRRAFDHAMRNCVFVVFIPLSTLATIALGLLFKYVDGLKASLDALWMPLLLFLAISFLVISHVFVKKRIAHYAAAPSAAREFDTEKDRAMARMAYFATLLGSVGLMMFIFVG